MGHASRSSGLLRLKISQTRVFSMASRLVEAQRGWCTWCHCEGCVEMKLKTDGSMRRGTSDPRGMDLLATSPKFHMHFLVWD
jgi:hypothetical protein